MRPLSLSMSAFGPFASTQALDFTALGTNPLFLINGPQARVRRPCSMAFVLRSMAKPQVMSVKVAKCAVIWPTIVTNRSHFQFSARQ